jgi:hypothetical protein
LPSSLVPARLLRFRGLLLHTTRPAPTMHTSILLAGAFSRPLSLSLLPAKPKAFAPCIISIRLGQCVRLHFSGGKLDFWSNHDRRASSSSAGRTGGMHSSF